MMDCARRNARPWRKINAPCNCLSFGTRLPADTPVGEYLDI